MIQAKAAILPEATPWIVITSSEPNRTIQAQLILKNQSNVAPTLHKGKRS